MSNLLKAPEAAALLGIKVGTLYIWTSKRLIPFIKMNGNTIRFDGVELERWLAERRVAAIATTAPGQGAAS